MSELVVSTELLLDERNCGETDDDAPTVDSNSLVAEPAALMLEIWISDEVGLEEVGVSISLLIELLVLMLKEVTRGVVDDAALVEASLWLEA